MKKLFCVVLLLFVFPAGCNTPKPPTPKLDFRGRIAVSYGESGENYLEATVVSGSQCTLSLDVTTPDEIAGLSYKWRENLQVQLQDISVEMDKDYFPKTSIPQAVYNLIFSLNRNGELQSFEDGTATYTGECESGEYVAVTDDTGNLQNASIKELNLHIKFIYTQ